MERWGDGEITAIVDVLAGMDFLIKVQIFKACCQYCPLHRSLQFSRALWTGRACRSAYFVTQFASESGATEAETLSFS